MFDVLALPELQRVVIEIDDRGSLGPSGNVLLRGLEAHIGLHGVAVEVREGARRKGFSPPTTHDPCESRRR